MFGLGQREPEVLDGERRRQSRRAVSPLDNLRSVSLVDTRVEQRVGQNIERKMALDPAFLQQRQYLAHALEGCRGEDVGSELDEVCRSGVFANHKEPLPQSLNQRADSFQRPAPAPP